MKALNFSAILATSLLLIGCGGGGGGGATPASTGIPLASAAAPFTVAGFGAVAGPSAATVLAATSASSGLDSIASAGGNALLPSDAAGLAKWALGRFGSTRESAQAVETIPTEACPSGGTLSGSFNDADGNEDLSAGDAVTLNFSNCVLQVGQQAVNGSFTISVNSIAYIGQEISSASLTMSFSNFSSYGNTLNGAATIAISGNSVSTTYTNFSSTRGSTPAVILNYTAAINGNALSINGLITINNNTYTLSTPTGITFGTTYPISGILRVTDAAGGRIDIISSNVSGPFVDCDLYLTGDNIRDGRISSAWSAI